MAVTNFTPLLGLALPTTGDLQGTWGTTVNTAITTLLDSAVAGTTTLSADADVTLSTTNGAANQARNAIILWTASNGATTRNITAPAQSKAYIVINAGTGSVVIRGAGPTAGVTVTSGYKALVAWNGSDFVRIASTLVSLTSEVTGTLPVANGGTGVTTSTGTGNNVLSTSPTLVAPNLGTPTSIDLTNATGLPTASITGTVAVLNGGTGQTSYTNGQLLIGNSTGNTLTKATLTAGSGISIASGAGAITITAIGSPTTVPIGTDITVTNYSLTLAAALSASASSTIRTQMVALDATRELILFLGAANMQAVVYDSSADAFGAVVLVRTASFSSIPIVSEAALSLISSSSVLVCSLVSGTDALQTVVLSITNSTITVNTAVATTLAANNSLINANTRLVAVGSSFVLNYFTGTATGLPKFRAITVSGTTPTIGSELAYAGGDNLHHSYAYTSSVLLHISCSNTAVYVYPISVSGSTLTGGTATTLTASDFDSSLLLNSGVLSTGRVAIAYKTSLTVISCAVISVTGTVASSSIAANTLATTSGSSISMQIFSNQAFVYGYASTGNNEIKVLTDTAGVATVGTGNSPGNYQMVGYLSTGKVLLSSAISASGIPYNSSYLQYGISSGDVVLEKTFQTTIVNGTLITNSATSPLGIVSGAPYKFPLSGPPNSGNRYPSSFSNLSLRTSAGKTCSMQTDGLPFTTSIDGNTVARSQQAGITIANNSVSDALSTATGWFFYLTLSTTSLIFNVRKMVLS